MTGNTKGACLAPFVTAFPSLWAEALKRYFWPSRDGAVGILLLLAIGSHLLSTANKASTSIADKQGVFRLICIPTYTL